MGAKRILLILVLAGLSCGGRLMASTAPTVTTKILTRKITIEVRNQPLGYVLQLIEQKAYFSFSYNSSIIDEEKLVSIQLNNQPVSEGLDLLFNETIRYKEAGNHLVLLKNETTPVQKSKTKDSNYFTGKITDERTGQPIDGASIYDVEARYASISHSGGNYQLALPVGENMRGFYFSKTGYRDTLLVVSADVSLINSIALQPLEEEIEKLPATSVSPIHRDIEESPIGKIIIPSDDYVHSENLSAIEETRAAQISFLPMWGIGSNLSTNGLVVNHFSLNVLAGYSNGVSGAEIGGIMNATKNRVVGVQVGGIGNLVGGTVEGVQVGGISNIVFSDVRGVQVGGVSNLVKGNVNGVQVGGVSNMISGGFDGFQLAGINNFAAKNSRGVQIAGINNFVADTLYGGQVAGIGNWARHGVNRCQVSGITNIAHINSGLQLTGIYNYCNTNKGLQIGLINSSISGKGAAIGLFSFCKNGYRATEISVNEVFVTNLAFKTGTDVFYNYYIFSANPGNRMHVGFGMGFGNKTMLGKKISLSTELTAYVTQLNDFDSFQGNELYRLSLSVDFRLGKWMTFYIGPSFNTGIMRQKNSEGGFEEFISYDPMYVANYSNTQLQMWAGGQAGIRIGKDRYQ